MRQKKILLAVFIYITVGMFNRCNEPVSKILEKAIAPPIPNIHLDFEFFKIAAEESHIIPLPDGGHIKVPENAFVDENNNPVTGTVFLKYREFNTADKIFLSGITMEYKTEGKTIQFESAGMFEITGEKNGSPVFIKDGKKVDVTIGSMREETDFNFYFLDTVAANWEYKGIESPKTNLAKDSLLSILKIVPEKPLEPKTYSGTGILLDFNIDYKKFEELQAFHGIMWEYCGNQESMNPAMNKWIYTEKWSNIHLDPYESEENIYKVTMSSKYKKFETIVFPVLSGRSAKKAGEEFATKLKDYENILEARKQTEEMAKSEAAVLRSFEINRFGVYNWDRQMKEENMIFCNAQFTFDEDVNIDLNKVPVYLIVKNRNAVVKYKDVFSREKFAFSPFDENKLVAILPGQRFAVFSTADFKKINAGSVDGTDYSFRLTVKKSEIKTADQILKSLESI